MDPLSPKPERSRPTTLWPDLLHTTPVQLQGDEFFWSQEERGLKGSIILDLNEIKASLSVTILKVAD